MFPSNASKPCWTASGPSCAPNWTRLAGRGPAFFHLLIPSPRVTSQEQTTLTAGSVSGFKCSPAARPTSSCCTSICAILPTSFSRKPSVFWGSILSTPRSINCRRRNLPDNGEETTMAPATNKGIIDKPSYHSVEQTVENLKNILKSKGVTLFALVDHS